jgi:hypothetical protein
VQSGWAAQADGMRLKLAGTYYKGYCAPVGNNLWRKFKVLKSEAKMSSPKLETLNSKQTQMSKRLNSKQIAEKPKLPFEFYILDLPALLSTG